jgi:hypothetical protein
MPSAQIRLELKRDVEDLGILALAADRLPQIVALAAEVGPRVGTLAVAKVLSDEVGIEAGELRLLLSTLINVYNTKARLKLSAGDTVDAIAYNLKRFAKDPKDAERLRAWEKGREQIAKALDQLNPNHALIAAFKAYRVATSHPYELVGFKIYTDVRPVFNEAGDAILQTIINHVLSIDYHDGQDHHVIQFDLDANDVVDLKELCERAQKKATVIKRDLKDMPWPTTIFRESTDQNPQSQ